MERRSAQPYACWPCFFSVRSGAFCGNDKNDARFVTRRAQKSDEGESIAMIGNSHCASFFTAGCAKAMARLETRFGWPFRILKKSRRSAPAQFRKRPSRDPVRVPTLRQRCSARFASVLAVPLSLFRTLLCGHRPSPGLLAGSPFVLLSAY